ncbi:MAG TPA: hypothetical protein PK370_00625 [Candidatus Woesebacteria bacterium]|nr:hypothetical protein [Candidatus Woesebacteria bacterium]HPJ17181.1 hypothetical protein [Candidatus Woesebacteria bacterium]
MLVTIIKLVAVLFYLYYLWKRLRDDYKTDWLISLGWVSLLGMLVGGRIVYGLVNWGIWNENWVNWLMVFSHPGFNFLGGLLGWAIAVYLYNIESGWKNWAFMEDILPSFWIFLMIFLLGELVASKGDIKVVFVFIPILISFILGWLVSKKYRSFWWYKSGKKGFGFFFSMIVYGISRSVVGILIKESWPMMVVYAVISLVSIVGLFILGDERRK